MIFDAQSHPRWRKAFVEHDDDGHHDDDYDDHHDHGMPMMIMTIMMVN